MRQIILSFLIFIFTSMAHADKNMKIGSKGKESEVSRVVKGVMYDNYYEPSSVKISAGETIKFVVENAGELVHEVNNTNKMMRMKQHAAREKKVQTDNV